MDGGRGKSWKAGRGQGSSPVTQPLTLGTHSLSFHQLLASLETGDQAVTAAASRAFLYSVLRTCVRYLTVNLVELSDVGRLVELAARESGPEFPETIRS